MTAWGVPDPAAEPDGMGLQPRGRRPRGRPGRRARRDPAYWSGRGDGGQHLVRRWRWHGADRPDRLNGPTGPTGAGGGGGGSLVASTSITSDVSFSDGSEHYRGCHLHGDRVEQLLDREFVAASSRELRARGVRRGRSGGRHRHRPDGSLGNRQRRGGAVPGCGGPPRRHSERGVDHLPCGCTSRRRRWHD